MAEGPQRSNERGQGFEATIGRLLNVLQATHPTVITVRRQPKIVLHNGEDVFPDYELKCALPHQTDIRLIECLDAAQRHVGRRSGKKSRRKWVVAEVSSSTGRGDRGGYPNSRWFVVDAMLRLVYPARRGVREEFIGTPWHHLRFRSFLTFLGEVKRC